MPSYTYQWRRCNSSGASCSDIVGETSSTYVLQAADIGSTIRCVVSDGTTTVTSAQSGVIQSAASFGPLVFEDNFRDQAMMATPSVPAGATWPTMPGTIPKLVPPFGWEHPYTYPGSRDGFVSGLVAGTHALRFHLRDSEKIAQMGGNDYTWGGSISGAETNAYPNWRVGGVWVGYRLGQTDYYGLRVKFPSNPGTCYSIAQYGYPVIRYSNIAIRTYNNELGLNQASGYANNVANGTNTQSVFHVNITPNGSGTVVLNRWYDVITKVKWSTTGTGELAVWTRAPEVSMTWELKHNATAIDTQQWGYEYSGTTGHFVPQAGEARVVADKLSLYRYGLLNPGDLICDYNRFLIGTTFAQVEYFLDR